ncbi:MAG TPA: hypothetical protein VG797_02600, partial [Phycisphaerales bacterium]|nr:hypothetical protein [Phycisphaerales bacterium]
TNLHSQTAIAKLGAVREGVLRHYRLMPKFGDPTAPPIPTDAVFFSILAAEWPAVKRKLLQRLGRS